MLLWVLALVTASVFATLGPPVPQAGATRPPTDLGQATPTATDGSIVVGYTGDSKAFVLDLAAPRPTMVTLGTLAGDTESSAYDVEGDIVVGVSNRLRPGGGCCISRAFYYDLGAPQPTMVALGTLGGAESSALRIGDGVIVGWAGVAPGIYHAYAYDLNAADPAMMDLDSLAPGFGAAAMDGRIVVGTAERPDGTHRRATAIDLSGPQPRVTDLGTLGSDYSFATAVSGSIVVGYSGLARGYQPPHAFAYDLAAAEPRMRDLGVLRRDSQATAVDGNLVVGFSPTEDNGASHAFVYDLAAARPRMRDLGTLGGSRSYAYGVKDGVVVGAAERAADNREHAFAYDLGAQRQEMTDLGTLSAPNGRVSQALFVLGGTVIGTSSRTWNGQGTDHLATWTLAKSGAPEIEFTQVQYLVQENIGTARIRVRRSGDTSRPVSVTYAATRARAVPGKDFTQVTGRLSFAAGVTRKSFTVHVHDDRRREGNEPVLLTLTAPAGGAELGTPNAAALTILASDQWPDLSIGAGPGESAAWAGSWVVNTTAVNQTLRKPAERAQKRNFWVQQWDDQAKRMPVTFRGSASPPRSTVQYFEGGKDITTAMRSTRGFPVPDIRSVKIRVQITIHRNAGVGSQKTVYVTAAWKGDRVNKDRVRGIVRVVR